MAKKIDIDYWKQIHDFTFAKFSWEKQSALFNFGLHHISSSSRELLDILHTLLDGHTVKTSGKPEVKYELTPEFLDDAKTSERKLILEFYRTNMAWAYVESHLGTPTDYLHLVKIKLIALGKLPRPDYMKLKPPPSDKSVGIEGLKILQLRHDKYVEKQQKLIQDMFKLVEGSVNNILGNLYVNQTNVSIKTLFPMKRLQTESRKGKLKNHPNDTPIHIIESAHLMISKDKGISYAQNLFARATGKGRRKKVSRNTFYKDWENFKFQALRYLLLKYAHEELLLTEPKQKYWKSRLFLYVEQRKVNNDRGTYEMVLYFTDEAINRIRKSWEDTNLPQECIITSSFNKLDFRKKDFFDKKLPYPTIYLQL